MHDSAAKAKRIARQERTAGLKLSRVHRRLAGAGLVALALVAAMVYIVLPWGETCRPCYMDFWYYLSAARALGAGQNPYDIETVKAFWVGEPLPFYWITYPPYFLATLQPLAWLPPRMAERAWTVLNLLTVGGLGVLLLQIAQLRITPFRLTAALALLLGFFPMLAVLNLGQVTAMLVAVAYLAWWLLQQGRPEAAGLALALLTIKPHWLLTPLVFLAVRREWRALGAFALGAGALVLPGWSLLPSWYDGMRAMTEHQAVFRAWANPSFLDLMTHLDVFAPEIRVALAGTVSVALLVTFVLLARRTVGGPGLPLTARENLVVALGWTLLPLILPQFRAYDLLVLVGPIFVLGRMLWSVQRAWAGIGCLVLAWTWPYIQLLAGALDFGLYNFWVWWLVMPLAVLPAALAAFRTVHPDFRAGGTAAATIAERR